MTTTVSIAHRGPSLPVEVEHNGKKTVILPGQFIDATFWHDGQPVIIREVPPTTKGASTPT